jgi:hypothetical protein
MLIASSRLWRRTPNIAPWAIAHGYGRTLSSVVCWRAEGLVSDHYPPTSDRSPGVILRRAWARSRSRAVALHLWWALVCEAHRVRPVVQLSSGRRCIRLPVTRPSGLSRPFGLLSLERCSLCAPARRCPCRNRCSSPTRQARSLTCMTSETSGWSMTVSPQVASSSGQEVTAAAWPRRLSSTLGHRRGPELGASRRRLDAGSSMRPTTAQVCGAIAR